MPFLFLPDWFESYTGPKRAAPSTQRPLSIRQHQEPVCVWLLTPAGLMLGSGADSCSLCKELYVNLKRELSGKPCDPLCPFTSFVKWERWVYHHHTWSGFMRAKSGDARCLFRRRALIWGRLSFYYYWILMFQNAQLGEFFIKLICQNRNTSWRRLDCKGRIRWMRTYYVHKCLLEKLFSTDLTEIWKIRSQISLTTETLKEGWSQLLSILLVRRMSWLSSGCWSHISQLK